MSFVNCDCLGYLVGNFDALIAVLDPEVVRRAD
jgi:hypothetical protein